jgi:hypothetical protein
MGGRQAFLLLIVGKSGSGKSAMAWEVMWRRPHARGVRAGSLEGRKSPMFAKENFREETSLRPSFRLPRKTPPPSPRPLAVLLARGALPGKPASRSSPRDLLADREAVVWRGETLLLDPRRKWEVV